MSIQWVFDNASELSINRLDTVGSTTARDGTYRSVTRGSNPKIFTVKLPDGPRYSDIRANILAMEALDRHTSQTGVEIKYSLYPWYYGYSDPGTNETYELICVNFPQWNIFDRNQVSWNGPFVFIEVL